MRPNSNDFRARENDRSWTRLKGMVRRAVVSATNAVRWTLHGFEGLDGESESDEAEVFDGIGVHARPAAGGRPEVVRLCVGGEPDNIVVVGARDRQTLAAVLQVLVGDDVLAADETLLYNSQCVVYLRDDGTIEAKTPGGTAVALATATHVHGPGSFTNGGGGVTGESGGPTAAIGSADPAVTSKLKGE